jgi:hypothetical protein
MEREQKVGGGFTSRRKWTRTLELFSNSGIEQARNFHYQFKGRNRGNAGMDVVKEKNEASSVLNIPRTLVIDPKTPQPQVEKTRYIQ